MEKRADGLRAVEFPYELLRRWPDPEAPNLFASDATDRLLMDVSAPAILEATAGTVTVIGDRYGALTLGSMSLGASGVRVHQDSCGGQMALAANSQHLLDQGVLDQVDYRECPMGEELVAGARVVLIQLPKDLEQLDRWVSLVAEYSDPAVQVFAGGRVKHMTKSQNQILEKYFVNVTASLGRQKSRVLVAGGVRSDRPVLKEQLRKFYDPELGLWVCSAPGAFAAGRVDHGSRFLAQFVKQMPSGRGDRLTAADLGCGTGVLSAVLAQSHPEYYVIATDRSAAAVVSARATLTKNVPDGRWEVRQDNALRLQPDSSLDLVICNPPFHSEASISTELSELLFAEAGRALRPGGVMLTVFNSHLPHRASLERLVGPTQQIGRNPKFTVTRSVK